MTVDDRASSPDGERASEASSQTQAAAHQIEGSVAFGGGDVRVEGFYAAGGSMTIDQRDQSVHQTVLSVLSFRSIRKVYLPPSQLQMARARRDLLAEMRRTWIRNVLEESAQQEALIQLRFFEIPGLIDRPGGQPIRSEDSKPPIEVKSIRESYDDNLGRLLIVGAPGAGKTTVLLMLARELLDEADSKVTARMPVVFQLAAWAEMRLPLDAWLTQELNKRYGVSLQIARRWIAYDEVIPLLDGLDEVPREYRAECLQAINAFRANHGQVPLVICSRSAEFEALTVRPHLKGAVALQPLTRDAVDRYLEQAGAQLAGVREALSHDEQLWELLTTPLFLTIVAMAYKDKAASAIQATDSIDERRRHLFTTYVAEMLTRRRTGVRSEHSQYSRESTVHWLTWLAATMRDHNQGLLQLEWIQPSWLPSRIQRWLATSGVAIGIGFLAMLLASLVVLSINGMDSDVARWLDVGLFCGLAYSLVAGSRLGTEASDSANQSLLRPARLRNPLLRPVTVGLVIGPIILLGEALPEPWGYLIATASVGCLGVSLVTYSQNVVPTERPRWSWAGFRYSFLTRFASALLFWPIAILTITTLVVILAILTSPAPSVEQSTDDGSFSLFNEPRTEADAILLFVFFIFLIPLIGAVSGLVVGLIFGFVDGAIGGLVVQPSVNPGSPNAGIRSSAQTAITGGLLCALALGFIGMVTATGISSYFEAGFSDGGLWRALSFSLGLGVGSGLAIALQYGGSACIRHLMIRALLVRNGSIPWAYIQFLNYATDHLLLRQVGGGYLFVHGLLLDYFINPETARMNRHPITPQATANDAAP